MTCVLFDEVEICDMCLCLMEWRHVTCVLFDEVETCDMCLCLMEWRPLIFALFDVATIFAVFLGNEFLLY